MKSAKQRIIGISVVLALAIVLSCVLVACRKVDEKDFSATIHPNNGQSDVAWDITKDVPSFTKEGYHVAGYYLDAQFTVNTSLESMKITGLTKNVDVYVKWEEHLEETDDEVAPTCTTSGLSAGSHCAICKATLQAQTVIPALGHDYKEEITPPTCTKNGYTTHKCSRCSDTYTDTFTRSLGHDYRDGVCTRCKEKYESSGLSFSLNDDGNGYTVTGIGTCTDTVVCIPSEYNSKPVTSIGNEAFRNVDALLKIIIPDTVTSIGEKAFYSCYYIKSISIGSGVTEIGSEAFSNCNALEYFVVSDDNVAYTCVDGILYDVNKTNILLVPISISGDITIPDTATSIGEGVFQNREKLTGITIGNGVISIGKCAFWNCFALARVTFGNNVTSIGSSAFASTALKTVVIPGSVTSLGAAVFESCKNLTSVTIGSGVTAIDEYTFGSCEKLSSVILHDGITSIGESAFSGCASLTNFNIPSGVTTIDKNAFERCKGLTSISIPSGVTTIGAGAFFYCSSLSSITVSKENKKYHSTDNCLIDDNNTLVLGCKNSVIPTDGSVTSIGSYAFGGCTGLTSIVIPDSVTVIDGYAFYECTALTSITIPAGISEICDYSFYNCKKLMNIVFKGTVEKWHNIVKRNQWNTGVPSDCVVTCSDGTTTL